MTSRPHPLISRAARATTRPASHPRLMVDCAPCPTALAVARAFDGAPMFTGHDGGGAHARFCGLGRDYSRRCSHTHERKSCLCCRFFVVQSDCRTANLRIPNLTIHVLLTSHAHEPEAMCMTLDPRASRPWVWLRQTIQDQGIWIPGPSSRLDRLPSRGFYISPAVFIYS